MVGGYRAGQYTAYYSTWHNRAAHYRTEQPQYIIEQVCYRAVHYRAGLELAGIWLAFGIWQYIMAVYYAWQYITEQYIIEQSRALYYRAVHCSIIIIEPYNIEQGRATL